MNETGFCYYPWTGLVCLVITIVYVGVSIWYTKKNPFGKSVVYNTLISKTLDLIFLHKTSRLDLHIDWEKSNYEANNDDRKKIYFLVGEILRKKM